MKKHSLRLTAIAGTLALLAGACSTTSGGSAGNTTGGGGADRGLVVSGSLPVENLDPQSAQGGSLGKELVFKQIFSRLVMLDSDARLTPDLAEKWASNDDSTKWTFTLRTGVKFSDGSALDSADVVATFNRMIRLKSPIAGNFTDVTASAPDANTVVLTAKSPDAAIPAKVTALYLLPAEYGDKDAVPNPPVGSGPFTVTSFSNGQDVVLAPNATFWGGAPKLTKLTIRTIPDVSTRLAALRTGEVDVAWGIPDDQLTTLQSDDKLQTQAVDSDASFLMWFNSSIPALATPEVRKALWQAVDFKTIISQLYPQTGSPADAPISPKVFGYAPQTPVGYDPDAAKKALTDAGFDFSKTLRLQFQSQFKPFVQAVVSDLAKIGVKVDAQEKEQAVYIDDLLALKWDINMQQVGTAGFDASTNIGRLYTCKANRMGYCNKDLDVLLAKAGGEKDQDTRKQLYAQAQKIIWDDAVGMFPMFVKISYAWNKQLKGFTPDPAALPDFRNVTVG